MQSNKDCVAYLVNSNSPVPCVHNGKCQDGKFMTLDADWPPLWSSTIRGCGNKDATLLSVRQQCDTGQQDGVMQ
jgi:hypothetical protein